MGRIFVPDSTQAWGRFRLTTRDAVTGQIHEEVETDNLITSVGLNLLAYGFVANLVQNQNVGWGTPIPTKYSNLGNCYGAMGTSSTAPNAADVALGNEIGRTLVTNAAVTTNVFELDFFFGTGSANGTIAEFGAFMQAALLTTTLTGGLSSGTTYASINFNPYLVTAPYSPLPVGTILQIGYGSTSPTQYAVTTGTLANGATSVGITAVGGGSFVANANYSVGTTVAFGPNATGTTQPTSGGSLFDHAVLSTPVPKNNSETATLALQVTLTSS